jgi:hypothetical protein
LPAGTGDEGTSDTANAQRATQQSSSDEGETSEGSTLLALLSVEADAGGQPSVVCPPGMPPGSKVKVKDASGRVVSVACK